MTADPAAPEAGASEVSARFAADLDASDELKPNTGNPTAAKPNTGKLNTGKASVSDEDQTSDESHARVKVKKAPNAFRTISEVADDLHIPQHVLRFWETKFPQVKPMKRGGGRRYYRPDDIALLRRISDMLYTQGYTIKGVQRLLREGGGQLSDDIPPAPEEERAAARAEQHLHDDQADLPIPGLELAPDPVQAQTALPRPVQRRRADPEVERLRAVLAETLAELEAIRELLG